MVVSNPAPSPSPPPGGGGGGGGDVAGAISGNHGHIAVVTAAQITAANSVNLDIRGTATHPHTVELSAAEVGMIGQQQKVSKTSSNDDGHDAHGDVQLNTIRESRELRTRECRGLSDRLLESSGSRFLVLYVSAQPSRYSRFRKSFAAALLVTRMFSPS